MKEVTDPALLEQLEQKEVTDPAILAQLEGIKPSIKPSESWYKAPARAGLETAGLIGGGTLGAGGGPLGIVAGAGLGYAAAKKTEELLGLKQIPKNIVEAGKELGTDIATGIAIEASGQVVGKGLQVAGDYLLPFARRLYGSAVKTPLTKKWVETLSSGEVSKRTKALDVGIKEKVPPSEYGLELVKKLERETSSIVDSITTQGAKQGDEIVTKDLIDKGFKRAYEIADKSSDPVGARKLLDSFVKKFESHGATIRVDKLNEIKRQLYKEVSWQVAQKTGLASQLKEAYKKGLAHEAMTFLENQYPQLDALNAKDSALIALREALERSLGRMENKDMISLGTKVLTHKETWPLAILNSTIGHPQVKARLAFALSKANIISPKAAELTTKGLGIVSQFESQGGGQ